MIWQELEDNGEGKVVYQRIDDDGLVRITAVKGYPELDAYLQWVDEGNDPNEFWTQESEVN